MDRRRFLKYAGATAAVVGGSALGLDYYLRQSPTIGNTVTLTSTTRGLTSTESLSSIRSPSSTTTSAEGFSA